MRIIHVVAAALMLAFMATATSAEMTPESIIKLEREWADAMKTQDLERLYPMMHQEFRLMGDNASFEVRKGEWLLNTMHAMSFKKVEIINPQAVVYGDTAVVSMRMDLDWAFRDEALPGSYNLLDTWVKTDEGWQVISRISHQLNE